VSEGTKGLIEYEFARQRVTLCKDGLPGRTVWLVIKKYAGWHHHALTTRLAHFFLWHLMLHQASYGDNPRILLN